jgi:glycopeptide antibiotics resistance protein
MLLFLYAALFSRRVTAEPKYELHLFWSYKKAIHSSSSFLVRQILYNILAFVPLGNALNYLMDEKREWKRVLAVFVLASLGVELIQLIFHLGLFEFDDIFNNLLGGILGYALAESMRKILKWNREKQENDI